MFQNQLKRMSGLEKPIFRYPLWEWKAAKATSGGPNRFDCNKNFAILIFPCGGATGKLNTFLQVPPQITVASWGS